MRWLGDQEKLLEQLYWPQGHSQVILKEKNCLLLFLAIMFQETGYRQREHLKSSQMIIKNNYIIFNKII